MSLLNPPPESENKSNAMKYTMIAVAMAAIIGGWFLFRYFPEKSRRTKTIPLFVDTGSKSISFSPNSPDE